MWRKIIGGAVFGLLALMNIPGAVAAPEIEVTGAWARAMPPVVRRSAAYFEIHNQGDESDRLLGVATVVAEQSRLHKTVEQNGVYSMQHIMGVDINPGKKISFEPRGRHVMLIGLKRPLISGDRFTLTLKFQKSGNITVPVEVRPLTEK